jgi:hypothetical protein
MRSQLATPMRFSDLKRIINEMDETRWGNTVIEVNDDTNGTFGNNLPPAPEGSAAAKWYGVSPGEPSKLILQFVNTTR